MTTKKKPLPESLAKPINIAAAQPNSLRKQVGLPPDNSDVENHIFNERCRRIESLDAYFGLDADAPNLMEQRVKALLVYAYDIPVDAPDWLPRLCWELMRKHIPGFAFGKRGRRRIWTFDELIVLGQDIRVFQARYPDVTVEALYIALRSRHPKTWGQHGVPALRKAHSTYRALARKFPKPTVASGPPSTTPRNVRPLDN